MSPFPYSNNNKNNNKKHDGSLLFALEANGYEQLEEAMDVIKRRVTSMRKVNKHWNVSMSSLFNHLNGKNRCKKIGPLGVLT